VNGGIVLTVALMVVIVRLGQEGMVDSVITAVKEMETAKDLVLELSEAMRRNHIMLGEQIAVIPHLLLLKNGDQTFN
jgi:hypothetical protein